MINKLYALGFSVILSSQVFATEITQQDFDSYKNESGLRGVVTRSLESIMRLNKQESKVEPYGREYDRINTEKSHMQNNIWQACLHTGSQSEMDDVGIIQCSTNKLLLNLKIKDGWRTSEQTIELTKD